MGTTAQKFQAIADSKADVKAAIIGKGVAVGDAVPFSEYGNKIRQISTGGGDTIDRTKPVLFFDHDGTLVASRTVAEAQALSVLPALPYHEGLLATGWTHTLEQVKAAKVLHVGVMYRTADGKTHAWVTLTPVSGLDLPICFTVSGTATIRVDWGDGQTEDVTTTSTLTHSYMSAGNYEITLERIAGTGTYSLGGGSSTTSFIGAGTAGYRQVLTKLYIGDNATIGIHAFSGCSSLASVAIPQGAAEIGNYAFRDCRSLAAIIIPHGATSAKYYMAGGCASLVVIVIPRGVKSIDNFLCSSCAALKAVIIPPEVESIGAYSFNNCHCLSDIILESEIPPSLADINAFSGGTSIRKYYVPDASVEEYKTATNWATYADYIYPISER